MHERAAVMQVVGIVHINGGKTSIKIYTNSYGTEEAAIGNGA
jgi:hypothetical protein